MANAGDDTLQNFFSRPIKIASFGWGTGTTLYQSFNPWTLFFTNPRVLNRITNFNLIRGKLHVKFLLNGNGFHYGRAIASYQPFHLSDSFTRDRGISFAADAVESSQRPHVFLDPTKSQGGTIVCPMVIPVNAVDIPDGLWSVLGQMSVRSLQELKHANGASDSVTISVFAWLSDVVLSVPTANEPGGLAPQAGPYECQADEYGTGPISRPASTIARAAGALAKVPIIAPYAKATQMAASTVSAVATAFGYSRPVNVPDARSIIPQYMGNLVNTNVPDSSIKLAVDLKQELSVDTRTFGLDGTDEMTVKSIATRESYLTSFAWLMADTAESLLFNIEVSPVVWREQTIGGVTEFHMPASAYATIPFDHWRGTMKYRFQIVCSAYHKGRLKIVYDPSYPKTNEYNTNYTYIVDIAKQRDFTVEIGWGQQYQYLRHRTMMLNLPPYSSLPLGADAGQFANGILSVYVVNELTTPNSTVINDIEVNVLVSAGDDIEVANPNWDVQNYTFFPEPQFGEYTMQAGELGSNQPDADDTPMESVPITQMVAHSIAAKPSNTDNTNSVVFGEAITSFRQLLKRYNYHTSFFFDTPGDVLEYRRGNFPFYRGYAPGAVHTALGPLPYNYARTTMINWLTPAYVCRRGGIRWKYLYECPNPTNSSVIMAVQREAALYGLYGSITSTPPPMSASESTKAKFDIDTQLGLMAGGHATIVSHNPVLEFELPFMQGVRFAPGRQANQTQSPDYTEFHVFQGKALQSADAQTEYCGVKTFVAAAEDFTLGFYVGPPVVFNLPSPAAA